MEPDGLTTVRRSSALGGTDIGRCLTAIHHDRYTPAVAIEDAVRDRLVAKGRSFEDDVVDRLRELHPNIVSIPFATTLSAAVAATVEAMEHRAPLILGGRLARPDRRSVGLPDVLLLLDDGYVAIEIKSHKVIGDSGAPARVTPIEAIGTTDGEEARFRSFRRRDLLQVAHYRALLQDIGHASSQPLGGVIGSDQPLSCTWVDLTGGEPSIDDDYRTYLEAADEVIRNGEAHPRSPLVPAAWRNECTRCSWADLCRAELTEVNDPTLLRGVDASLRALLASDGVTSIANIADLPLADERIEDPDVITQARAITAGRLLRLQNGDGPLGLPGSAVEVDFDIETINGRIYLAGFLITEQGSSRFDPVVEWDDTPDAERTLLERLFERFAEWDDTGTIVYHWTSYESRTISEAAARHGLSIPGHDTVTSWFEANAFDLYEWTRAHLVSPSGYSLKVIAPMCGFHWRDEDPGGLQSEIWYEALQAGDEAMADRLLAYNEDDVIAQREVRRWVRQQDSGDGPGSAIPSVHGWPVG